MIEYKMEFINYMVKRKRNAPAKIDIDHVESLEDIQDSQWNNESDDHQNRNTKGLDMDVKLTWDNWTHFHSIIVPKVNIEQVGKRIRVGKARTIRWINCERSEYMLTNCLSADVQKMFNGYSTTREKWRKLYKHFSGKNKARSQSAMKKLTTSSRGTKSLVDFISFIENLVKECEIAYGSESIRFEDLGKTMLLSGLDSSFNAVRTILENEKDDEISLQELAERLKTDEENRNQDGEGMANNLVPTPIKCSYERVPEKCWLCTPSSHPK
jgi:hypothetical protein